MKLLEFLFRFQKDIRRTFLLSCLFKKPYVECVLFQFGRAFLFKKKMVRKDVFSNYVIRSQVSLDYTRQKNATENASVLHVHHIEHIVVPLNKISVWYDTCKFIEKLYGLFKVEKLQYA